ncbi:MAG TPA: hypothetical protein VNO70_17230, partial [Blastocatellia bacterium]|nr:hypothetical protein [Blastocatellia bacterium]
MLNAEYLKLTHHESRIGDTVLETLNRYIDDGPARQFPDSLRASAIRNRRFGGLLALSVVAHLLFFAFLVRLDWIMRFEAEGERRRPVELAQITEIALPPDRAYKLRPAPERFESADLSRLQFDPERGDDVHLKSRSPNPAPPRRSGAPIPSAQQIEQGLKQSRSSGGSPTPRNGQLPPAIRPPEVNRVAAVESPIVAQLPSQTVTAP